MNCLSCGKELYKGKKYCSNVCQQAYQNEAKINSWLLGEWDGSDSGKTNKGDLAQVIRNWLLKRADYKCSNCGWDEINKYTKKVPLQINHIDGDHTNNVLENLEVLCPNCHSLTENYGSRNTGNGRRYFRKLWHKEFSGE